MDGIYKKLLAVKGTVLPKSKLGEAVDYALGQWARLTLFPRYPEIELSNNLAENSMRPIAAGRKNWPCAENRVFQFGGAAFTAGGASLGRTQTAIIEAEKMAGLPQQEDRRAALALSAIASILSGLCCFPPIVMVLLGLGSVSVANDWGNWLYGEYQWHFRAAGTVFLIAAMVLYYRRRGICTLDQAKRERGRILNTVFLVALVFLAVYIFWTYVVLHYWGIAVGLPWAQWDESWAIPVSAGLFAAVAVALLISRRRRGEANIAASQAPLTSGSRVK